MKPSSLLALGLGFTSTASALPFSHQLPFSSGNPSFSVAEYLSGTIHNWFGAAQPQAQTPPRMGISGPNKAAKKAIAGYGKNAPVKASNVSSPVFVTYGDQDNGGSIGVPDDPATQLKGYTHYNIAFWTIKYGPADNAGIWAAASQSKQKAVKQKYVDAGIKLMVSAFGATDTPQSSGLSATEVATRLANFVKQNNLDGVDVDYEEINLFGQGASLPWLIALQRHLREQLPSPQYTISHAPLAPWFSWATYADGGYATFDDKIGETIDFYNVQFYNQGLYTDCNSLLFQSGGFAPQSSLFEIHNQGGVPLERLLVGKPATKQDADNNGDGWLTPATLGGCLRQAKAKGWNTGFMYWEYPNANLARMNNVKVNAGWPADGY